MRGSEEQIMYLFEFAGMTFIKHVCSLEFLASSRNKVRILTIQHRDLPGNVAKRFVKTPDDYLCSGDFHSGTGEKDQVAFYWDNEMKIGYISESGLL